jgi:hypothetical protein
VRNRIVSSLARRSAAEGRWRRQHHGFDIAARLYFSIIVLEDGVRGCLEEAEADYSARRGVVCVCARMCICLRSGIGKRRGNLWLVVDWIRLEGTGTEGVWRRPHGSHRRAG